MIVGFIDEYRKVYSVESICRVLAAHGVQIAPRTYRRARRRPPSHRDIADAYLENSLRDVHGKPEEMYGRRKMTRYLRRQGHEAAFCTVDRLMRALGMNGAVRGRRHRTTIPSKDGVRAGDKLNRGVQLEDDRAGIQSAQHGCLATRPLRAPDRARADPSFRCRQQYTSVKFTESLALQGFSASVGSVGDAYDNALAESIIGLFKTEVVNRRAPFKTLADVEYSLMEWVDWYNNARLHSRLDYLTPAEYESTYYAQQPPRRPALV